TPEIKNKYIQSLIAGRDGSLWIGTAGGLISLKDGKFTTLAIPGGMAANCINTLYEDRQGNLWIGTYGAGLTRFRNGEFTRYTSQEGLASDFVYAVIEDHAGNLWVGTRQGLDCFKDGKFTHYTVKDGLPFEQVAAIHESRDRSLWIGTAGGLTRFKDSRFTTYTQNDGLSFEIVKCIREDQAGVLWIGTEGGGLNRFVDGKFTAFSLKEGLSNSSVLDLYQDREGMLWIGTLGGGLNRLRDDRIITYTTKEGLVNDVALAIYQGRDRSIWIGTIGGLTRFKDGQFSNYLTRDGAADIKVLALTEDDGGNLWIGTNGGLCRFKNGQYTTYTAKDGLSHNTIRALHYDRDGTLWIGTRGGLDRLKDGKFMPPSTLGFQSNTVHIIYEDRGGSLWFGSNEGLARFKDGQFTTYTTREGLSHDFVFSIHEDAEGTIWIGTAGGGLNRFKEGKFVGYGTKDGLFDDGVHQILEDARGNLWMSCNRGVFRVSKRELNDFAEGKIRAVTSVVFGTSDGMKSSECNGSTQPAGIKTGDGRLWFPTMKGAAVIDPDAIRSQRLPPLVHIESIVANNQKAILTGNPGLISFSSNTPRLEINYEGISLSAPEKVRFRYYLEGFDRDWIDAGSRRVTYYTNLPPGTYRFKVMAGNSDGVWNETAASYEFYLAPRFYQQYWFYLLCAALVACTGWGIYRLRVRQMQARFLAVLEERNRIAREMHDTLIRGIVGASALLGAGSKMLTVSTQQADTYLEMASVELKKSLDEVRVAVSGLREAATDEDSLPNAINSVIRRMTAGTTIDARCIVRGHPQPMPEAVAEHLLQIGREAVANAVQHAAAGHILVEVQFDPHLFEMHISDDGMGFEVDKPKSDGASHFGLIGMRERAEAIGGQLILESQPGEGTRVSVRVALNGSTRYATPNGHDRSPWSRLRRLMLR
ncbi:MAG TPA: two-component regulator propeller domain-containing protein, partial [Blastocatellia bacterium]|nr:two-component regulator propeller domain-containing protein [Blastocatellia bacterium]